MEELTKMKVYYDINWIESATSGKLVIKEVCAFEKEEDVKKAYNYVITELKKIAKRKVV